MYVSPNKNYHTENFIKIIFLNKFCKLNKIINTKLKNILISSGSDHRLVQRIAQNNQGLAKKVYEDADADLQLKGWYYA